MEQEHSNEENSTTVMMILPNNLAIDPDFLNIRIKESKQ